MRTKKPFHVLYVVGCSEGESKRYRVYNLIEALTPLGVSAQPVSPEDLLFQHARDYSLVVFFRCEYNRITARFVEKCRKADVATVFDVDDLIFDDTIVEDIDAFRHMDENDRKRYLLGVQSYRNMLEACDYVTASTEYLCQYIREKTGKQVFYIANGLNRMQIETAQTVRQEEYKVQKIGFLSGSRTHQKDFEQAAPAVAHVLQKYPEAVLTVIGYLEIPKCLTDLTDRIEILPFMDYKDLLRICRELYVVIVPLEYETAFCQAKSELKYFEQALLGVPVVASPTAPFAASIQDGVNGFLAENKKEWEEKLDCLLSSPNLRNEMGRKAAAQIRARFYPDVIGEQAKQTYAQILLDRAYKQVDETHLRVSFVIPEPLKGAGGHRNIFRAARAFSRRGHQVTIYTDGFTGRFLHAAALKRFVKKHFFDTGADFVLGSDEIKPCDLLIATQWKTAYAVKNFQHYCALPCYFIQDFEPYFYPMGEEYIQAYATYSFGFAQLASGRWAAKMAEKASDRPCPYFHFPLTRDIYRTYPELRREEQTIIFFARPSMPRRGYTLGVEAMRLLKEQRPEVRIIFYGDDAKRYGDYGFDYEKRGMLKGPKELARLYNTATVGICFSLTNPSLVPYEMMACGLPVVDLDFNGSSAAYGGRDVVSLADPTAKSVCDTVCRLLDCPEERMQCQKNGLALVGEMPDETEMEDIVYNTWLKMLRDQYFD